MVIEGKIEVREGQCHSALVSVAIPEHRTNPLVDLLRFEQPVVQCGHMLFIVMRESQRIKWL